MAASGREAVGRSGGGRGWRRPHARACRGQARPCPESRLFGSWTACGVWTGAILLVEGKRCRRLWTEGRLRRGRQGAQDPSVRRVDFATAAPWPETFRQLGGRGRRVAGPCQAPGARVPEAPSPPPTQLTPPHPTSPAKTQACGHHTPPHRAYITPLSPFGGPTSILKGCPDVPPWRGELMKTPRPGRAATPAPGHSYWARHGFFCWRGEASCAGREGRRGRAW